MRLNYFGYSVRKVADNSHYLMDLRQFLKAFSDYSNMAFKNKFTHTGEQVYLLPVTNNFYLFVITRSDEIIKKVKSDNAGVSVNEIYNLLQTGENIGFASYLYVDRYYFAFASKMLSPKSTVFANFVNNIFFELGITDYSFDVHPFLQQSTREQVLTMPFIGRSTIQINKDHSLGERFKEIFGATVQDFSDIESFEIVIKPKRGRDIKEAVTKALAVIPDNGLRSMVIKAKEELEGNLKDLYIISEGAISDIVDTTDERIILDRIRSKINDNTLLAEKVGEHERNNAFTQQNIESIARLFTITNWPAVN